MWRPPINFVTLHYAWIILMGLFSLVILYPYGNLKAIDAYFFGASASTESGLNTVDVKDLKTYQQLYIYFIPIITNLGFINIVVIIVRLFWFRKHLKRLAPDAARSRRHDASGADIEQDQDQSDGAVAVSSSTDTPSAGLVVASSKHIAFDASTDRHPKNDTALYIPSPRDRERGHPLVEKLKDDESDGEEEPDANDVAGPSSSTPRRRLRRSIDGPRITAAKSIDRAVTVASSVLVLGSTPTRDRRRSTSSIQPTPALNDMPFLSQQVTVGRNSQFRNLTSRDRELLGGIEYRSLKLLLKITLLTNSPHAYFFGLHLFGAICLVGWIHRAAPKYTDYLESVAQDKTWWAFYSAQSMVDNLGFTLTPDSMITFRDAAWPMIVMSFLAFAGNTLYPCCLRLVIWTISKVMPKHAPIQEPLVFLLKHPRRCYTLLFPSKPTWILFGIIFALNFVDTLLIIVLDLHNPEVAALPVGSRILAAIFQAASSRHTGTASFNLANVNPAVQFSLLVMMYIAVFPIAISIRASNSYEEKSLGIWENDGSLNEQNGASYLMTHIKNQLNFDLWYIFLGVFIICIAESDRIADINEPAFSIFSVLFEVTSAYGNVGLSLGYPTVATSLCGKFGTFGKVVICFMMIRGRHRGLPYTLDPAIMLPDERLLEDNMSRREAESQEKGK